MYSRFEGIHGHRVGKLPWRSYFNSVVEDQQSHRGRDSVVTVRHRVDQSLTQNFHGQFRRDLRFKALYLMRATEVDVKESHGIFEDIRDPPVDVFLVGGSTEMSDPGMLMAEM